MSELTSDDILKLTEQLASLNRTMVKGSKVSPSSKGPSHPTSGNTGGYRGGVGDEAVMKKLIQNQSKLSGASQNLAESMKRTTQATVSAANKFGSLANAASSATSSLSAVAKTFGAGGAVLMLAKQLDDTTDMYRKVNSYGQSFGGSMLQMQIAAADAALPLEQFAEVVKKNSVVLATVGAKSFFDMSKQLRASMTDVGQLGMTTGQLNDFMGQYMETQRLYGNVSGAMSDKSVTAMKNLAVETQKAAEATGMNRDVLAAATQTVLRDTTLRAKMSLSGSNGTDAFSQSLMRTTTYLTALPGEAGKVLSTMLAQTVGRGSALMADQTAQFAEAGMLGVTDLMDNLGRKVQNGTATGQDVADFNRKFVSEGMRNMESLKMQAATGNKAAAQAIDMILEAKESLKKDPQDLQQQKGITNFMLNFATILEMISGKLRGEFFRGLEHLMKGFEGFTERPEFKELTDKIGGMANRFGLFLSETVTPERLIAFGNGLASAAEFMVKFVSGLVSVIDTVVTSFGWLSDKIGVMGAAIAVFATYMAVKHTLKKAGSLLGERFNIGGQPESFATALSRYAQGNTLRTTSSGRAGARGLGGAGAGGLGGAGAGGAGGAGAGGAGGLPNLPNPNHPSHPRHPDHHNWQSQNQHGPQIPRGERTTRRLERFGEAGQDFRDRARTTLSNATRNPGETIRSTRTRVAGTVLRGSTRVGGAIRSAGSSLGRGASMLGRGAAGVARGVGPAAVVGGLAAGALALAPDFKGKDTLQSIATYAAMGSMLGPIGTAVGAAAGAIFANWDDLSDIVGNTFAAIANVNYAAPFQAIGNMLGSIGDGAKWIGTKYIAGWQAIGGFAMAGVSAIAAFDYKGALNTAGELLSPLADGASWMATTYMNTWKSIGSTLMDGVNSVASFDYVGAWGSLTDVSSAVMTSIGGAFSSIGTSLSGVFNWASDLLKPKDGGGLFSTLMNLTPVTSAIGALVTGSTTVTGPINPKGAATPDVNPESMTAQMTEMKEQSARVSKENSELKAQMAQLMESLAKGSASQVGGLKDLIAEQKKANGNLGTLAGTVI